MMRWPVVLAVLFTLAACGDKPQTLQGDGINQGNAAFQGTGMPYVANGWKAGDKVSWEAQLRTRTQRGQNEYSRAN